MSDDQDLMFGTVTAYREAVLTLTLRDANGRDTNIDAVVDTGFTDELTLPASILDALQAPFVGTVRTTLGDGSRAQMAVFRAVVLWYGQERAIDVLQAEGSPLLGMSLLYGSRLTLDILDGSPFTLDPLV